MQLKIVKTGTLLLAAACAGALFSQPSRQPQNQQNPPIRYQIVFSPWARSETYLIDTQEGKVWSPVTYSDLNGDPTVWREVPRIDSPAQMEALAKAYGYKAKR